MKTKVRNPKVGEVWFDGEGILCGPLEATPSYAMFSNSHPLQCPGRRKTYTLKGWHGYTEAEYKSDNLVLIHKNAAGKVINAVASSATPPVANPPKVQETINHPPHYGGDTTYEAIKVIDAWGLGFNLGNTVKYISRAGKKTPSRLKDLKKAEWYLQREIAKEEDNEASKT